eukprot:762163-Hanusia_phi.AAC.5
MHRKSRNQKDATEAREGVKGKTGLCIAFKSRRREGYRRGEVERQGRGRSMSWGGSCKRGRSGGTGGFTGTIEREKGGGGSVWVGGR